MKKFTRLLSILLVLCMVLSLLPTAFAAEGTVDFEFLVTSDIHGKFFATDYSSGVDNSGTYRQGITRVASYIKEQKAIYGDNVYTVDMGDTIQGEPLTYYYAFNGEKLGVDDPAIKTFRSIGYDMWMLGNHEFNYGLNILKRQMAQAIAPATENEKQLVICEANYLDADTNNAESKSWDTYGDIVPYVIQDFDGVKVAIIGFGTPNIAKWDGPENWKGFYFESMYETYKHYEAELLEKSDMIVVMAHCGVEGEMADEAYDSVRYLVEHTNTIDFAFSGHAHGTRVNDIANSDGKIVKVLQPGTKAALISQVKVSYDKTTGEATIDAKNVDMKNYAFDEATVALLQPYEDNVWQNYMLNKIGEAGDDFSAANLGTAPSAFMDLINTVQLWGAYDNTGLNTPDDTSDDQPAQLSISAPLTSGSNPNLISKGDIYLGDLFALYRYENWFYQLTMSGKEVRTWLEYSASKLRKTPSGSIAVDGGLTYYDVIYGEDFSYVLDPTQPEGMRVVSMTYKGKEVADSQEFTIVMNNYRFTGGGNYVNYCNEHGCDLSNLEERIIYSTQYDMIQGEDLGQARTLLMNYIIEKGTIQPTITSTWSVKSSDINILYTNDVHTYIDGDISYDTVAAMKDAYEAAGEDVLLVDAGDHVQGTAYGGLDKGANIMALMASAGYDLATLGNHEFDYGMARALEVSNAAKNGGIPYVSCNFYHEKDGVIGDRVLDSYKVFEIGGKKIAFIGITTPESFTKSTPKYFQDEEGNYIYGISGGEDGAALYADVQAAIDEVKATGVDYIIALGHLGVDPSSKPWTSEDVIANTTGLDAFIDGHSHSTVAMKNVKDKDGNDVVLTQTGSYFDTVGRMSISEDGTITTGLVNYYAGSDEATKTIQDSWIASVDEQLGQKIAESEINFTTKDAEGNRAVRKYETNMGNLNADAYYWFLENSSIDVDVAIMNGGGIRADAPAGDWTYKTCKTVNTFGNVLCAMEVTGQQIKDALEWGARQTPIAEIGGFLHTSGLTYEVDGSITSTVQMDEKTVWIGAPTGEYRVKNIKVYNKETKAYEPIELDKTYILAGTNYTLRDLGDGFAMFDGAKLVIDYVSEDYLAMAAYVSAFTDTDGNGYANIASANSPLAAHENFLINYESETGAGRIAVTEGETEWDGKIIIGGLEANLWTTKYGNIYTNASAENVFEDLGFDYGDIITVSFLDQNLDLPLVSNFSDVDSGTPALFVGKNDLGNPTGYAYLAINMGNFTETYGIATKKTDEAGDWYWEAKEGVEFPIEVTFTLKEAGGYMAEYLLHQLQRTNNREDYSELTDEEFANFRNVDTTGMGANIFYRSSSPINPELGRNTYADAAIEAAGVKTIMNLADNAESAKAYEGFEDSYYSKQNVIYLNLGVDFFDDSFKAGLAKGLRHFATNEGPYMVHCTEGKDRAGFISALLECFMGATYDEVVADYMVTYYNYYGVEVGSEQYDAIANSNIIKTLKRAFDVEDLTTADLAAEAREYIFSLGLTEDEVAQLYCNLMASRFELVADSSNMFKYGHLDLNVSTEDFLKYFSYGDIVTVSFNGQSYDFPVCSNYDDVDTFEYLIRAASGKSVVTMAINYGQLGVLSGIIEVAPEGSATKYQLKDGVTFPIVATVAMKEAGGYADELSIRQLNRTNNREDYPELTDEQFANFRKVTTTGVADGILYRSSSPINPELGRNTYADAAAKNAGVKTFINLADTEEEATAYEGYAESYYSAQNHIFLGLPVAFTSDTFKNGLAEGFRFMTVNEGPYLIHCTEGKDRAGLTTAILECFMGATVDEITTDYVTTFRNYYNVVDGVQTALTETQEAYLRSAILKNLCLIFDMEDTTTADLAAEARAYMLEIGLTEAEVEILYTNLSGKEEPIEPTEPTEPIEPIEPIDYDDVADNAWYKEAVDYASVNGLMNGMGNNKFEPETVMTRAMLVTVLWRNAGSPKAGKNTFTDVKDGQWFTEAIAWAAENGIVNGMGNNTFEPDGELTREQLATILYRYAKLKNLNTDKRADFSKFVDGGKVNSWAKEAVQWAVAEGILLGSKEPNGLYLLPRDGATRAQVATMLMRYFEGVMKG